MNSLLFPLQIVLPSPLMASLRPIDAMMPCSCRPLETGLLLLMLDPTLSLVMIVVSVALFSILVAAFLLYYTGFSEARLEARQWRRPSPELSHAAHVAHGEGRRDEIDQTANDHPLLSQRGDLQP